MDAINERFKILRESCQKTQTEWADILGLSRSGVSEIEAGRRNVTKKEIRSLGLWDSYKDKAINIHWLSTGNG